MLEVLLLCIKHEFKKAEERMEYLVDRLAWDPSCIVNGCQALVKYSRISVAQELCKRAFKYVPKDPLISLQLMKISLDLGDLEEFDDIVDVNGNMLERVEFPDPFIPYDGLIKTRQSWRELIEESGAEQRPLKSLMKLSEKLIIENNLRRFQVDSFSDPEGNHLYIHVGINGSSGDEIASLNHALINLMVEEFSVEPPRASIQFVPAKQ